MITNPHIEQFVGLLGEHCKQLAELLRRYPHSAILRQKLEDAELSYFEAHYQWMQGVECGTTPKDD